jgi:multidrug resistance protein, MATE family
LSDNELRKALSSITTYLELPNIHHSPFNIHHSLFNIHHSSFNIHHSTFIIQHSSFTIHHSSFTIHHSSFNIGLIIMLNPPSYGEILRFAIPIVLGLLTTALHTLIDTLFIGQLGTAQLAAVPLAGVVYISGWVLLTGILRNSIAFIGRAFGAHQYHKIGVILAHYHIIALLGLPLIGLLIQIWPLFSAIANLNAAIDNYAWIYLKIRVWEAPFSLSLVLYSSFYQAQGHSLFPMQVIVGTLLVNIVLDYGLIFGELGMPALGVAGSAYATVLAQAFGASIIIITSFVRSTRTQFHLQLLTRIDVALLKNILRIGLPQGIGDAIETLTWIGLFLIVGQLGEVALAANNIGVQVVHLLFLPGAAIGTAAASYMSRFLGSQQPEFAKIATYRTLVLGITYMGLLGIPLWFFGESIASWFTNDPAVIYQAGLMFKVMALFQIFDGTNMILRSALSGAGDTFVPTLLLILCAVFVMFPTAFLLSRWIEPGLVGAWLGGFAYLFILATVITYRYRSEKWKTIMGSDGVQSEALLVSSKA